MLEFARLLLEIDAARNPMASMDVTAATVHRSTGYRKLRAFFLHLSQRKRERFRQHMLTTIAGVREVMAKAKATGEPLSMGDIVIEFKDEEGVPLPAPPALGEGLEPDSEPTA